jgi:hypothetical protein
MIRITSDYLKKGDIAILRRFCYFTLHKLLTPAVVKKSSISIKILKNEDLAHGEDVLDLKDYGAWVVYDGVFDGKKKFSMVLNARRLNRNAKKPMYRLRKIMHDAAHELVHIKQYLNNELFDYADGKARFKGEIFPLGKSDDDDDVYFNSPWEIEAYGREVGMYKMFLKKYKQEQKEKAKK